MNPLIYYDNILTEYSSDQNASLAVNGLTYDYWQGPNLGDNTLVFNGLSKPANYFAIAGHNLAGTLVLLHSSQGLVSLYSPPNNAPFAVRFSGVSSPSWTITTDRSDGMARISVLQIGTYMELERGMWAGHSPLTLNQSTDYQNSVSDTGQLLGRKIVRRGARGRIRVDNLSSDWVRDKWQPFADHARKRGFFFQHNQDQFPTEVAYCWSTDDASANNDRVGGPDNRGLMSAEIPVRAIV